MNLTSFFEKANLASIFGALLTLLIGLFVARKLHDSIGHLSHLDSQQKVALQKVGYYLLVAIIIAASLNQLGFDLKVLLGAAGVLTVAIGFAAQTSASNLVSGLFLLVDRPFTIGHVIRVDNFTGEVLSIDLLSCKLRTLDNLMVRVPNETMVKSTITNLSHFPIRRLDLQFRLDFSEKIDRVEALLMDVADRDPLCLQDPGPLFIFQGFGESGINIQFSVWTSRENVGQFQNRIYREILAAFESNGIKMIYPQRTVHMITEPVRPRA